MAESDFPCPYIIGDGSSPSRCGPNRFAAVGQTWDLPVPAEEASAHAGSSTTPGCPDARADASVHVAFRLRNSVGAQDANLCEAQLLAYAFPYRRFAAALAGVRARLRVDADRYSLIVSDFHRLLLAGLSGALRKTLDTTNSR
jgi:hypothetical protein